MNYDFTGVRSSPVTAGEARPLHVARTAIDYMGEGVVMRAVVGVQGMDADGDTPLHLAAGTNAREVAALLIEQGADVNAKAASLGTTPLHWAAVVNGRDVAALMIEQGADVNAKATEGDTPLSIAQRRKPWDIVRARAGRSPAEGFARHAGGGTNRPD